MTLHVTARPGPPRQGTEPVTAPAASSVSWSKLYAARREVADRFGDIWDLPVRKRWRDVLRRQLTGSGTGVSPVTSLLEVGAGDRRVGTWLAEQRPDLTYRSMDIDREQPHDYYRLEDVDRTFDGVLALEVIEHLELNEACRLLERLFELTEPGGLLVLTTPNTYYPPAYLRDATHRTPFCYDELGSVVTMAGFRVERLLRIYNAPLHRKIAHRWLFGWLHRFIGIDFARQIMLVARKP